MSVGKHRKRLFGDNDYYMTQQEIADAFNNGTADEIIRNMPERYLDETSVDADLWDLFFRGSE